MDKKSKTPIGSATLTAEVIEALSVAAITGHELVTGADAFLHQINEAHAGIFVFRPEGRGPKDPGVWVAAYDPYRLLAIYDEAGYASSDIRLHLPDAMFEAAAVKKARLTDENGEYFHVAMSPKPARVICTEITGIVTAEGDYEGTLGGWMTEDIGNVIQIDSYRCNAANGRYIDYIQDQLNLLTGDIDVASSQFTIPTGVNPGLLAPIVHAAKYTEGPFEMFGHAQPDPNNPQNPIGTIVFRSKDRKMIFSLGVAVLKGEQ